MSSANDIAIVNLFLPNICH